MPLKKVLAFDFGASGGRAVLFSLNSGKLEASEVHRFANDPVEVNGTLYWDVLRLYHEIKQGIQKAKAAGGFHVIGIDTWGVDFGMLDKAGNLLANPVHYRDGRTEGMIEEVDKIIPRRELYANCGLQFMRFNTLYQLYYLSRYQRELYERIDKILLMPDLFAYFLTGEKRAEFSNVSTTQMLDQKNNCWDTALLAKLGIRASILPEMIDTGSAYGNLKREIAEELGVAQVPVVAVATHDTASAVVAVPQQKKDFIFLSCGTWSLFGTECDSVVISEASYEAKLTNERGIKSSTRLLKNIMGLWIIQECKRQWEREGHKLSFSEIACLAEESPAFHCLIDVDDPVFELPGDMPERIRLYCAERGQKAPQTVGEVSRCVYESLALKYRYTLEELTRVTGKTYASVNIVGGGCNAEILCRFTASACGLEVLAGPAEGTATGNALVQLMHIGEIKSLAEARAIVAGSTQIKVYQPAEQSVWEKQYQLFKKQMGGEN